MASHKDPNAVRPAPSGSSVDNALLAKAMRKVLDRQELTGAERDALHRHEKQKEEGLRWKYYRSIPQKHWKEMSGRQTKVINEQAARYGIPFGGPTIDLHAVVKEFHDFLARNAQRFALDDDILLQGGNSPALEEYRVERTKLVRYERMERERQLLPRNEVREGLARIAAIFRNANDAIQQQFGSTAAEILNDALSDAQRDIDRTFGETHQNDAPDAP